MKQTARMVSSVLLMSFIIQLFSGLFGFTQVEARSLRLFNQSYSSSLSDSAQYLTTSQQFSGEDEMSSESDTQSGPPEPPESFSEIPEESIPESNEPLDDNQESTQSVESSSQELSSQQSSESTSSSDSLTNSASNQPPMQQDETQANTPLMQIAPGSLMIKPANTVEPINITSTVKKLTSHYYEVVMVSIKSCVFTAQQLMFPSEALVIQKISNHLIGYFESLLTLIIQT